MNRVLKVVVRWCVLIGCLVVSVAFFATNRADLDALWRITPLEIVVLLTLHFGYFGLQSLRNKIVLEKVSGHSLAFGAWFRIFLVASIFGAVIPQAGSVYRAIRLKRDFDVGFTNYLASLMAFAWIDTFFNLLVVLLVLVLTGSGIKIGSLRATSVIVCILIALIAVPVTLMAVSRRLVFARRLAARLHDVIGEMLTLCMRTVRDPYFLLRLFLLGLGVMGVVTLIFYVCFRSLGVDTGVGEVVVLFAFLKLSSHVSVTPGNIGVRELGFGLLGGQMHFGVGQGILASAILRLISYASVLILAVPTGAILDVFRGGDTLGNRPKSSDP